MGFGGGGTLSSLLIDVAKDWNGFKIQDVGNCGADMDATNQISVLTWLGHEIPTIYTFGADRLISTVYQATDPGARLVHIVGYGAVSAVNANPHGGARIIVYVGSTVACADFSFIGGIPNLNLTNLNPAAANQIEVDITLVAIVPHNYYYKVEFDVADDGSADIQEWLEYRPSN